MPGKPTTFRELFKFYHEYVKLLYSSVQAGGSLPTEVLFELNAALDHVSRHWAYGETEPEVVDKAYSHLKRSCLDIFKLKVKEAYDQFSELRKIDTSVLDNGDFDRALIALHHKIKTDATEARRLEGESKSDSDCDIKAFSFWQPVYEDCIRLEREFYCHPKLTWAKKKVAFAKRKDLWISMAVAFVIGLITPTEWFQHWIRDSVFPRITHTTPANPSTNTSSPTTNLPTAPGTKKP
jgi:hypothetical protein